MSNNESAKMEKSNSKKKELGMGWHDFLVIWYGLTGWLGAIACVILMILGGIALEPAGIYGGALGLGVAVLTLTTKNKLDEFSEDAIDYLKALYTVRFVMIFVDIILSLIIDPHHTVDIKDVIFDVLRVVIFAAINLSYYKKREDMFIDEDDDEE